MAAIIGQLMEQIGEMEVSNIYCKLGFNVSKAFVQQTLIYLIRYILFKFLLLNVF